MNDNLCTFDDADENIMAILKKVAEEESRIKSKALPRWHDYRFYGIKFRTPRIETSKNVKNSKGDFNEL